MTRLTPASHKTVQLELEVLSCRQSLVHLLLCSREENIPSLVLKSPNPFGADL